MLRSLFYFNFVNEVINEEEDVLLATELDLFTINTITLLKVKILVAVAINAKTGTNGKIGTNAKIGIDTKTGTDFLFSTHNRQNFGRHYANLDQSARYEDNKVESTTKSRNSPSKFGCSQ
jgi:hypothetical protein